jgi:hypothetical protein
MKLYKSYKILIFILFTALFQGCLDDPVDYTGAMVEGSVYDQFGMYNPSVKVSVGDYPIVATDVYGKFSLENEHYPYNVTISDIHSYSVKFIGLTIPNPLLTTFEDYGNSNFCFARVHFPEITSEYDEAIIKFISADKNVQFDYKVRYTDSEFNIVVRILNDKNRIEGKLIFLQYSRFSSYKKFGIKDIELNAGYVNPEITFTDNDIEYNPTELYSEFNIQLSPEFNRINSIVSLLFPGMDNSYAIELPSNYYEPYGYIITPELPMVKYIVKFTNYASINNYQMPSQMWVYAAPGESISMNHTKSISLQQPANEETNVNENTEFTFSDNEPGGIYVFKFVPGTFSDYHLVDAVTDKYPITLRDLKTWGYQFKPNTTYRWGVVKYPGYNSIDDFVSSKYIEDTLYKKIPASERFSFTTQ